jgi:hypothetical protein
MKLSQFKIYRFRCSSRIAVTVAAVLLAVAASATAADESALSVSVVNTARLGLRFGPDGFGPVGREAASVSIPLQPQGAITLRMPAGRVTLAPLGVAAGAGVGQMVEGGGSVQYSGTARATTTRVLAPSGGGAEVVERLGSAGAPESFSWRVLIDGVEELVPRRDGGV